ncbi:hypothetical protein D3C86_1444470 [compost metagenome]
MPVHRIGHGLDDGGRAEHAGLGGVHANVRGDGIDLGGHQVGRNGVHASHAVMAVIALMPKQPSALKVFRSAWMPAPPPESEPAMVSVRGGVESMWAGRMAGRLEVE